MSTGPASRSASLPRFGRGAAVALFLLFLLLGVVFTAPLVQHLRHALPYAAVPTPGRELVYGVQGDYLQFYYYLWLVEERLLSGTSFLKDPYQFAIDGARANLPNIFLPAALLFVPLSAFGHRFAYNALVLLSFPFAGMAAALLARRYGVSRAGAFVAGRRLRLRALPGGGLARRASRRPCVSAGPARAVGGRGCAGGIARERPRGGRRAPRTRPDGAPLRVLCRSRPAGLCAGARRASRVATGAPGHRPRSLAGRGRCRPRPLLRSARRPQAPGLAGPAVREPRDRCGGRARCARDLAGAGGLASRGGCRDGSAPGRAAKSRGVPAVAPRGRGRDRPRAARRGRTCPAAPRPRGVALRRVAAVVVSQTPRDPGGARRLPAAWRPAASSCSCSDSS